ncbi:hypothetical protein B7P43_G16530 [Cryptotermes secundus]|uniref:Chitin-binding type-2 domain-containing protein n=3 Tax=Cryptotermes secundus TaxID=105785 RepID=A0A2J7PGS5_9NEOP|nr:homeobox protein 2 isoform X2 [Cryptotermes secundus]PNF15537.1 hypothetical protein B7P43_G16530 [Cryptotermes secundus]
MGRSTTIMKSLVFILGFLVVCVVAQKRPPNYSLDDMPETNFNCQDKILGGYYADHETDCQMFHVCVKVPGLGVQDYRFLCPNDTSFDQENQICANWFDIDCEAAALYYSDNFDLYRIGYNPSSPSLGTSNATPIPLGPSSIRPPVKAPAASKPRPRYKNRPSDEEEDYFLQRSETGDSRLQQKDLLRGSSSSNFFNPSKGKEDEDEDETYRDHKENNSFNGNTYRRPSNGNKKKVAVRKLVKRPNNNGFAQDGDNYPTPRPTTVSSSTFSQNNRGSNNYDNYNYNNNQRNSFGNQQQQNYNTGNYQSPGPFTTSNYKAPTTERSTSAVNNDRTPRTGNSYYQPRYNTIQRNNAQSSTTSQPLATNSAATNNYNYQQQSESNANNQGNNYNAANYYSTFSAQKSTTPKPIQYSTIETTAENYYNNYQSQPRSTNTQRYNTKSSGANTDNYPTTANTPVNLNNNYNFANYNTNGQRSQTTNDYKKSTVNNYYTTTSSPSTYDSYNSDNNHKRFGNSYNQRSTDYSNTKSTVGFISTTLAPASSAQAYNNYQSSNDDEYNNYNYQRTNQNYGHNKANADEFDTADEKTDEFLKTAPSNNYRPSSFNTFQNNYNTNSKSTTSVTNNYNYTSATASDNRSSQNYNSNYYNINTTPKSTSFTSSDTYSSDKQSSAGSSKYYSQTTVVPSGSFRAAETYPTTRRPQTTASQNYPKQTITPSSGREPVSTTKYQQQRNNYNVYSVSSTTVRTSEYDNAAANDDTKKTVTTGSKSGSKTSDVSYDYAYYDDGNTEYEGLDPVSDHHFGKGGESLKVARSTK